MKSETKSGKKKPAIVCDRCGAETYDAGRRTCPHCGYCFGCGQVMGRKEPTPPPINAVKPPAPPAPPRKLKYFKFEKTSDGFGDVGLKFDRVFSLAVGDDDERGKHIVFSEECDGYFTKELNKSDAIELLQEAINWIKEEIK